MRNSGRFIPRAISSRRSILQQMQSSTAASSARAPRCTDEVYNSVIGAALPSARAEVIRDSIIMRDCYHRRQLRNDKAIVAENHGGRRRRAGRGRVRTEQDTNPKVYQFDLVTIGEHTVIPDHVKIGKNTAISGVTTPEDYPGGALASGDYIIKAGGVR